MDISLGYYKGINCYYLENELLRLAVAPERGAKILSLLYKPQNFEVFFQPVDGTYPLAEYGADFARYDTSGADEMFPTIDACNYPYEGYSKVSLPDHGELWSLPWTVIEDQEALMTEIKGVALPYIFSRSITLCENILHCKYKVYNAGNQPLYGLWAFHGLVACDEWTTIILPDVKDVITVHNSKALGSVGTRHSFPSTIDQTGEQYSLQWIAPKSAGKTEKFYVDGSLLQGEAALTLNQGQLLYKVLFPVHKVPYLGVWCNEGGFKGEYNCALEPATGYYDSLEIANEQQSIQPLQPQETMEWYLDIELTPWPKTENNGLDKKR